MIWFDAVEWSALECPEHTMVHNFFRRFLHTDFLHHDRTSWQLSVVPLLRGWLVVYNPRRIHGTGTFIATWMADLMLICMVNVGKYTSPMDPMGNRFIHECLQFSFSAINHPQQLTPREMNPCTDRKSGDADSMGWLVGGFKFFTPKIGEDKHFWLIFFKGVETTNYCRWMLVFQIWMICFFHVSRPQSMQPLQSCCFAPAWYLYITYTSYTLNLTSSHGQEKGLSITFPHQKDRGQREQCNCTASREIGQYEHLVRRVHSCNPIQDETFKPLKLHSGWRGSLIWFTGAWRTLQIFLVWKRRRKCSWSKFCIVLLNKFR